MTPQKVFPIAAVLQQIAVQAGPRVPDETRAFSPWEGKPPQAMINSVWPV